MCSAKENFSFSLENTNKLPQCSGNQPEWTKCFGFAEISGFSLLGEFISGKLNGKGVMTYPSGHKIAGEFKENQLNDLHFQIQNNTTQLAEASENIAQSEQALVDVQAELLELLRT